MTLLERLRKLLVQISPEAICDDCITDSLDRADREHTNRRTRALARTPGFDRRKEKCGFCRRVKLVIRHVGGTGRQGSPADRTLFDWAIPIGLLLLP